MLEKCRSFLRAPFSPAANGDPFFPSRDRHFGERDTGKGAYFPCQLTYYSVLTTFPLSFSLGHRHSYPFPPSPTPFSLGRDIVLLSLHTWKEHNSVHPSASLHLCLLLTPFSLSPGALFYWLRDRFCPGSLARRPPYSLPSLPPNH